MFSKQKYNNRVYLIAAVFLALCAGLLNYWQTTRATPLLDYAYQVDAAYRIYQGEIPYRDFFLVVAPFTYYLIAFFIHLSNGYVHSVQVMATMTISVVNILLCYFLFTRISKSPGVSVMALLPLIFSGHAIYAYPFYDINVFLLIIAAFLITIRFENTYKHARFTGFCCGCLVALTALVKQNVGLAFLAAWAICVMAVWIISRKTTWRKFVFYAAAGISTTLGSFIWWLNHVHALEPYIYQTLIFPGKFRNPIAGLNNVRLEIESFIDHQKTVLLLFLIGAVILFVLLIMINKRLVEDPNTPVWKRRKTHLVQVSFVMAILGMGYSFYAGTFFDVNNGVWFTLIFFGLIAGLTNLYIDIRTGNFSFSTCIPFLCLGVFLAASVSQGFWGSTYGMWPLYFLLLLWILHWLITYFPVYPWKILAVIVCLYVTIIVGTISISQVRIRGFIDIAGQPQSASISSLQGLSTPGIWIPEFENLIKYVDQNIPASDKIAFLPGEDVFYEVTGRRNPMFCFCFLREACESNLNQAFKDAKEKRVDWVIVKTKFQLKYWNDIIKIADLNIPPEYRLADRVGIYNLYKREK